MATLRKRNGKWQVQIRRTHQPSINKSFTHKLHAQQWARKIEAEIDVKGLLPDTSVLKQHTLLDLINRYRDQITPKKRGHVNERIRLSQLARHQIASLLLINLKPAHINAYIEERMTLVSPGTAARDVGVLHQVVETAKSKWGIPFAEDLFKGVQRPKEPPSRDRRLDLHEEDLLLQGCNRSRVTYLKPIITLALETAMRRGEILRIEYDDINQANKTLKIPVTKNGYPRTIPLSSLALTTLLEAQRGTPGRIFPVTPNAFRLAWEKLRRRVGIENLHFHDLRHEAISRLFEKGLSIPEVALISGHRDYRMLFRYTHLRAEDVAKKLD
ncbi:MAG: site-specific integrase [Rhodospirillales bacterium]|jgi:integrase|nr:site-specific integrase [Rhodospirillaceae bacterium]MBT6110767.1 site-specific integrase [Rhodospirillales bacterium]